jgi:hypothetical protein
MKSKKVKNLSEKDQLIRHYTTLGYEIKTDQSNKTVLKEHDNGNSFIHVLLYLFGWLLFIISFNLTYDQALPLVFILSFIAIFGIFNIIYFIYSRKNSEEMIILIDDNLKSTDIKSHKYCPECGAEMNLEDTFCHECGNKLLNK